MKNKLEWQDQRWKCWDGSCVCVYTHCNDSDDHGKTVMRHSTFSWHRDKTRRHWGGWMIISYLQLIQSAPSKYSTYPYPTVCYHSGDVFGHPRGSRKFLLPFLVMKRPRWLKPYKLRNSPRMEMGLKSTVKSLIQVFDHMKESQI